MRWKHRRIDYEQWHRAFVWVPVCDGDTWYWLEHAWRRGTMYSSECGWMWEWRGGTDCPNVKKGG